MNCARYALISLNIVFVIAGIVLLALGIFGLKRDTTHFLGSDYVTVPSIICFVGVVVVVIAVLGCCGAIGPSSTKLSAYAIILIALIIVELGCGISMYLYRDNVFDILGQNMNETLKQEKNDSMMVLMVVEYYIGCCGINGPDDYKSTTLGEPPLSCCNVTAVQAMYERMQAARQRPIQDYDGAHLDFEDKPGNFEGGRVGDYDRAHLDFEDKPGNFKGGRVGDYDRAHFALEGQPGNFKGKPSSCPINNSQGCFIVLLDHIKEKIKWLALIAIITAALQIICVVMACSVAKDIKKRKS